MTRTPPTQQPANINHELRAKHNRRDAIARQWLIDNDVSRMDLIELIDPLRSNDGIEWVHLTAAQNGEPVALFEGDDDAIDAAIDEMGFIKAGQLHDELINDDEDTVAFIFNTNGRDPSDYTDRMNDRLTR